MKKPNDYDSTIAATGAFEALEPGGYICYIIAARAEEYDGRARLVIAFDIAEGEHKDYYRRKQEQFKGDWPGVYRQFVEAKDGTCSPFFKGMITAIEESSGIQWNWDEATLKGKMFGGVFGEEEYMNKAGEIKTIVRLSQVRSIQAIRKGEFAVPQLKKLRARGGAPSSDLDGFTTITSDHIPF